MTKKDVVLSADSYINSVAMQLMCAAVSVVQKGA